MYTEDDLSDAEDLYGRTKFLGEVDRPGCLTIRTSIIGRDFLKQQRAAGVVPGAARRHGAGATATPSSPASPRRPWRAIIGDVIERHPDLHGVYQVASEPDHQVRPADQDPRRDGSGHRRSSRSTTPPCDRSLDAARFVAATGCRIPTWDEMVAELAADPTPYDDWRRRHACRLRTSAS